MVIQQQKQFKILLIGDSCIDEYFYGSCDRLSPEAPVPVFKILHKDIKPGMASNVKQNLENLNIDVTFITNSEEIVKSRYIDQKSGQHLIRVDAETTVKGWNEAEINQFDGYDAVVISDYNKGFITYENIENIVKKFSGPIFIDTKKQDLARINSKNIFAKINESEYLKLNSRCDNLIVTLGNRGAMYKDNIFSTKQVEVTDVCGCGDTFLSALTYQYLIDKNINQSIIFANKAASITVQHIGVYAPTLKEIQ
jgi:bifunctional ADP-heptose synthase (sugar kinase/adenylyltransferase)